MIVSSILPSPPYGSSNHQGQWKKSGAGFPATLPCETIFERGGVVLDFDKTDAWKLDGGGGIGPLVGSVAIGSCT